MMKRSPSPGSHQPPTVLSLHRSNPGAIKKAMAIISAEVSTDEEQLLDRQPLVTFATAEDDVVGQEREERTRRSTRLKPAAAFETPAETFNRRMLRSLSPPASPRGIRLASNRDITVKDILLGDEVLSRAIMETVLSKPARASSTHVAETITASVIPILVFKWFAEVARCHSLMCASLRIELANKPNEYKDLILRQETPCARLLSAYAHTQAGPLYLVITRLIKKLSSTKKSFELSGEPLEVAENMVHLVKVLQSFTESILGDSQVFSQEFRYFLYKMYRIVQQEYPGYAYKAIGNLIFLRVICPALVQPGSTFKMKDVSPEAMRRLIMISRILMLLANEKHPAGPLDSEPIRLYLASYSRKLRQFLRDIMSDVKPDPRIPGADIGDVSTQKVRLTRFMADPRSTGSQEAGARSSLVRLLPIRSAPEEEADKDPLTAENPKQDCIRMCQALLPLLEHIRDTLIAKMNCTEVEATSKINRLGRSIRSHLESL